MARGSKAQAEVQETQEVSARPRPNLRLVKVDEMAPNLPRFGGGGGGGPKGPRDTYVKLLTPITEDDSNIGELFEVAEFASITGATLVKHNITVGRKDKETGELVKTPVPEGEWEFDTRRVYMDENGQRMTPAQVSAFKSSGGDLSRLKKHSILYARYLGK